MKKSPLRNDRGFTLIEIIAVLVILGILAAVAIPKYIDMREDAVIKAAQAANGELNARERLYLAQWKLKGCENAYPFLNDTTTVCTGTGLPLPGPTTNLGGDWPGSADFTVTGGNLTFQGKTVYFTRSASKLDPVNEPAFWTVSLKPPTAP